MSNDSARPKISIEIDGKTYTTRDDDQEAASLLRLAGRDPERFDLARPGANGKPKIIKDKKIIDLHDGDEFITVRQAPISFTIDGERFRTRDDDQEAAALLRLAGVSPDEYDLAKVIPGKEPRLYRDEKVVNIREGDTFVSVKHNGTVA